MLQIICKKDIRNGKCEFFHSIESMFENIHGEIKYFDSTVEGVATIEYVKSEIAKNGVASIHILDHVCDFCGIQLREFEPCVVSYVEVK